MVRETQLPHPTAAARGLARTRTGSSDRSRACDAMRAVRTPAPTKHAKRDWPQRHGRSTQSRHGRAPMPERDRTATVAETAAASDACGSTVVESRLPTRDGDDCPAHRSGGASCRRSARRSALVSAIVEPLAPLLDVCRTLRISCEAVPPSVPPAGAQGGTSACSTGAALSFVSCIRLFGGVVRPSHRHSR